MMKVTYDPADLRRAFELANRIAPTSKGGAWDKAAGMVMEVESDGSTTVVATDIDTALHVCFDATEVSDMPDETTRWRLSSLFLAPFVRKLYDPITVTGDASSSSILFKSGQSKVKVPLIPLGDYPDLHTPSGPAPVDSGSLTGLAERVLWACDSLATPGTPLRGLHVDGTNLVGCRHEALAVQPMKVDLENPITFQGGELMGLLRGQSGVRLSADDSRVFFWLNDTDWVSSSLIVAPYPIYANLQAVKQASTIRLNKAAVMDCLERMSVVASQDRAGGSSVQLRMTKTTFNLRVLVKDVGDSEETLTIKGGPEDGFAIAFGLNVLMDAIRNCVGDTFDLGFGNPNKPEQGHLSPIRITDDSGWESILMPRRPKSSS